MYYEERLINGIWYIKTIPDGEWRQKYTDTDRVTFTEYTFGIEEIIWN